MTKLYLFDLDQTLIDQSTCVLLPGVERWLKSHELDQMAICSNQGGVGLRHWMEVGKFGNPLSYPNHNKVADKIARLFEQIPSKVHFGLYMCYAYQSPKSKAWSPTPEGEEGNPFWRADWRKPAPGMLLQALSDYGVSSSEAVFVGDEESDMRAALAAQIEFIPADQFFHKR